MDCLAYFLAALYLAGIPALITGAIWLVVKAFRLARSLRLPQRKPKPPKPVASPTLDDRIGEEQKRHREAVRVVDTLDWEPDEKDAAKVALKQNHMRRIEELLS